MEMNIILEICMGFTPTTIRRPGRQDHFQLPEPENNLLVPTIKKINIVVKKQSQTEFQTQSVFLTEMLNNLRTLNLLDYYIKRDLDVNTRTFAENETTLDPPIQPNDLVHESSSQWRCFF